MRCALCPLFLALAVAAGVNAPPLAAQPKEKVEGKVTTADFGNLDIKNKAGKVVPGAKITEYTLTRGDMVVKCIDYGATITSIQVPDKDGKTGDVALGYDKIDGYLKSPYPFGATVGRTAGRIANGKFKIEDKEYPLTANEGATHFNGGKGGFQARKWRGEILNEKGRTAVKFTCTSPDGEEGYPGRLTLSVTYELVDRAGGPTLAINYEASTDKATLCNPAPYIYFNLGGHNSGNVLGHQAKINSAGWLLPDDKRVPAKYEFGKESPLHFDVAKEIGKDLPKAGAKPAGFDIHYVLGGNGQYRPVATVTEPKTGRRLSVVTDQIQVLHFETGNALDGKTVGKGGAVYKQHQGFCLSPQLLSNLVNSEELQKLWGKDATMVLLPGKTYNTNILYTFTTNPAK